jgi:hypothetical protein
MSTNVTKGIGREYNIGKYYEAYCIVVLGKFDSGEKVILS